jgi:hypothetical protein
MLAGDDRPCKLIWCAFARLFRSRAELEAEILVLRHQLNVLRRKSPGRLAFSSIDRLVFAGMYALAPNILDALKIVKPETVLRWHRGGFRAYWRWKSRPRGGRPSTPAEIRDLIREMSIANPLWGAPRIHGELLKLGIDVGQTTVAKYMASRSCPLKARCCPKMLARRIPRSIYEETRALLVGWPRQRHSSNHAAIARRSRAGALRMWPHSKREPVGLGCGNRPNASWSASKASTFANAGYDLRVL